MCRVGTADGLRIAFNNLQLACTPKKFRIPDGVFLPAGTYVYFDANLYGTLSAASAPNADWDVIILQQPNPVNVPPFDQGIFDAGARTDNPSLSGAFSVSFINLGAGTPGSQRFEVFDAETNLVDSGFTQEVRGIPEPADRADRRRLHEQSSRS
jgi:hypothetical protein